MTHIKNFGLFEAAAFSSILAKKTLTIEDLKDLLEEITTNGDFNNALEQLKKIKEKFPDLLISNPRQLRNGVVLNDDQIAVCDYYHATFLNHMFDFFYNTAEFKKHPKVIEDKITDLKNQLSDITTKRTKLVKEKEDEITKIEEKYKTSISELKKKAEDIVTKLDKINKTGSI